MLLLMEFILRKYTIMIAHFQKLISNGLRVEQKERMRTFSHVLQLMVTNNVRFK